MSTHEICLKIRKENPTMRIAEIARLVGKNPSTVLFHLNKSYRQNNITTRRKNRNNRKRKFVDKFGGKCSICGYDKCLAALHFHHKDPTKKEFTLANFYLSVNRIEKEVEKCILVCANCHCEIHAGLT